ncbi:MAG: Glycosyltransferase [uncultured Phycisphaerae bacterium]|uniref:Glycosyltransferase n=1 Tax=uncultured Phycisphaerae bacterium TaxID=904963 RepID=A0A6J4PJQ7_9BACT|nr:MAG: Glycosyltransferase [uncultured Phycisphaerae bacterium]
MNVLMTADTVGGVWVYALDLCRALAPHGVHVTLATMGEPVRPDQHAQLRALTNVTLRESRFKLEWMPDPWDDVARAGDWLLKLERETRPDVVHLSGYAHGCLPWRAPVLVAGHSCVLSWWRAVKGEPAPPEWDRYRWAVAEGLAGADLVVAPTAAMLDCLDFHYGPLAAGARVVHNGRDAAAFAPTAVKEPFVLCAGRLWDEAKNLAALEAVAPGLPWPVYAAGECDRPAGGVVPLGRLGERELAEIMGRAAIYALPARYEPFGLSALEAALSGCALVLGDIPSLREVWADAATYVPPDDARALERALAGLVEDPALRGEMSARATARARGYSMARAARSYLDVYHALAARSSSASPGPPGAGAASASAGNAGDPHPNPLAAYRERGQERTRDWSAAFSR